MRKGLPLLLGAITAAVGSHHAAAGDECRAAVEAAFAKQRTGKSFRLVAAMPGDGGVTRMTIDYVLPDRMHQKVEAPGQPAPVETIAIGRWAWGTQGGGWEELQPQFAQSVTAHVKEALAAAPKVTGEFACLGKVAHNGVEALAYQSVAPAAATPAGGGSGEPELARTIYVDPSSGLPVANVVATKSGGAAPVFDASYAYPEGLVVEAPIGEPK